MDYVYIGKIVNTHGIKGEVRILSDFDKKDIVFKKDFNIYIGNEKSHEIINSHRIHKNYNMITLKGISDINDVLKYKGKNVYVNRDDLNLSDKDYLLDDLIGMRIVSDEGSFGIVKDIVNNKAGNLLVVLYDKTYYIPYVDEYIKNVNLKTKEIEVERVRELL